MEQKLPYIHNVVGWNYRMTEMQSAIGMAELERMDNWNMPTRRRNAQIVIEALRQCPEVKYLPVDTDERRNGFYTHGVFPGYRKYGLRHPAVRASGGGGGRALLEGLLAAVSHRARLPGIRLLWQVGFPFRSKEYTNPASVDYSRVEVPNAAWHETHTFTVFPTRRLQKTICTRLRTLLSR